jgi:DHA1 family multidrug resistance protein-like MFS transporter
MKAAIREEWQHNLLWLWISQFFSLVGFSFALPFVPFYLQELGVTGTGALRVWSGYFAAGAGIPMAIATPIWGILADRRGRKLMILRANLGAAVVLLGMGLATGPGMLLFFRIMQGFLTGTVTANLTLVVSKTPENRLGFAIGVMNSAVFAGNALGPLFGGYLADMVGFRFSFFIATLFMIISFLVALIFVREDFRPRREDWAPRVSASRSGGLLDSLRGSMKSSLLTPALLSVVGLTFMLRFSRMIPRPIYPLFIEQIASPGLGVATQTGIVNACAGVAAVLAGIIVGRLADRGRVVNLGLICLLFSGFFLLPQGFMTSVWLLLPLRFLSDFCAGGADPIINMILARRVAPERRGAAFGLAGSAKSVGFSLAALSGGYLSAYLGFPAVFLTGAACFVLTAFFLLLLARRQPEEMSV